MLLSNLPIFICTLTHWMIKYSKQLFNFLHVFKIKLIQYYYCNTIRIDDNSKSTSYCCIANRWRKRQLFTSFGLKYRHNMTNFLLNDLSNYFRYKYQARFSNKKNDPLHSMYDTHIPVCQYTTSHIHLYQHVITLFGS